MKAEEGKSERENTKTGSQCKWKKKKLYTQTHAYLVLSESRRRKK